MKSGKCTAMNYMAGKLICTKYRPTQIDTKPNVYTGQRPAPVYIEHARLPV